ncbi:MAG: hypothetical protein KJ717_02070 [Proteobacteria bacterium]|nr:hypothetical protein [Pseudomonadota bacterium]
MEKTAQILPGRGSLGREKIITAKISFVLKGNVWYSKYLTAQEKNGMSCYPQNLRQNTTSNITTSSSVPTT